MYKNNLIQLTKDFVAINSISATKNKKGEWHENIMANAIKNAFAAYDIPAIFVPTKDGRNCVVVFKKGKSDKTLVLLAHHDTVGVEDMAGLPAFDVDKMAQIKKDPTYFHGRGAGDMKAGIAIAIGILEEVWDKKLDTNILFLSCPDEENDSTGILAGVTYLQKLKKVKKLIFLGAINLDSSMGNPQNPEEKEIIAGGTVGKLLPSFYIAGKAAHASAPFDGISSNSIASKIFQAIDCNPMLCESIQAEEKTPPPTFLKMIDVKDGYNTQLPIVSYMYCNYLTFQNTPHDVLRKLLVVTEKAFMSALTQHQDKAKRFFKNSAYTLGWLKDAKVYIYEDLLKKAKRQKGFQKEFEQFVKSLKISEPRDRNFHIVDFVAKKAHAPAPYVVLFFSPPFYPSFSDSTSVFVKNVVKTVAAFGKKKGISFAVKPVSEGISDMNYLQIPSKTLGQMESYEQNNPYFAVAPEIDLSAIADISMPVVGIGPHAFFPHHSEEKVEIEYTFSQLPKLLLEVIENVQG